MGISALAHSVATKKLYIFCNDYNTVTYSNFAVQVYVLDPLTNVVTHFAGPYQFGEIPTFGVDKCACHAAEYNGALFVAHQGNSAASHAYVTRLDLSTGAITLVAQPTGNANIDSGAGNVQPDFTGSMGVKAGVLYWTDGVGLWSGTGGALSFVGYLGYVDPVFTSDIDGMGACGSGVSSPLDGEWYFPGQYAGNEVGGTYGYGANLGIVRMIRTSANAVEFSPATPNGGTFENRTTCMTVLYAANDTTPLQLFALDDSSNSLGTLNIWKEDGGGTWSAEIDLHTFDANIRGVSCSMKSYLGELYVLAVGFKYTTLFKRSVAGSWSVFRNFPGYVAESPGFPTFAPMERVSNAIASHEM
jgi:hypothetical protein